MRYKSLPIVFLFLVYCETKSYSQTRINLRDQSNNVDFGNSPFTRPIRTGGSLPGGLCQLGELFYLTTSTTGGNLYGCDGNGNWTLQGGLMAGPANTLLSSNGVSAQWTGLNGDLSGTPTSLQVSGLRNRPVAADAPSSGQVLGWDGLNWKPVTLNGAAGTVTLKSGATTVGNGGVIQYVAGLGLVNAISLQAGELRVQQDIDSGVVLLKSAHQSGTTLRCEATATSNAYSCGLNPALGSYTTGMQLLLQAGATNTGSATLNVNGLGAVGLRRNDGVTELAAGDLVAGQAYPVWYDGTRFRLIEVSSPSRTREYCQSTSSSNAFTCTVSPGLNSYTVGMQILLLADTANTGAATLNLNGLGARAIRRADGSGNLLAGDLRAGEVHSLWYDGTVFRMTHKWVAERQNTYCTATSTANAFTCTVPTGVPAYVTGMQVLFRPDVTNTGAATLNLNGLGTVALRRADGSSELLAGDLEAGNSYPMWYDGSSFRMLVNPPALRGATGARPSCDVSRRGMIWHEFAGAGSKDTVAVCAKDAANTYAWRGIY